MKACIFGAGAIGGLLAVRLSQAGWEVSVIVRGSHLDAIRQGGLRLRSQREEVTVHPYATDRVVDIGSQDIVLVTTKTTSLVGIADNLSRLVGPETTVAFVTNGLPWWYLTQIEPSSKVWSAPVGEMIEAMSRTIPLSCCIGGVAYCASHIAEPGLIVNSNSDNSRFVFGAVKDEAAALCDALAAALTASGLPTQQQRPLAPVIWMKLLQNVVTAPLGALTGLTSKRVVTEPMLAATVKAATEETQSLAAACGVTDVAVDLEKFAARVADHKSSMLQDYELSRRPEIDTLLGALCDLGRIKGRRTPVLDMLYALTAAKARALGLYP